MATLTLPVEEKKKGTEQEALITGAEAIAIACKLATWMWSQLTQSGLTTRDAVHKPTGGRWRNGLRYIVAEASIHNLKS